MTLIFGTQLETVVVGGVAAALKMCVKRLSFWICSTVHVGSVDVEFQAVVVAPCDKALLQSSVLLSKCNLLVKIALES